MANDLSLQTGIGNDVNYVNGNIVNGQTVCGAGINQDIVQFFQKLMSEAGITADDTDENEANGYQFIEALGGLKKIIPIGAWNMDGTATVNIAHGMADIKKIVRVSASIVNDDGTFVYDFVTADGTLNASELQGAYAINPTNIVLARNLSGFFDTTDYDDAVINRGYVVMEYLL